MSKVLFFLVLASIASHNLIGSEHSKTSASQQTMDSLLAPLSQEDKKKINRRYSSFS